MIGSQNYSYDAFISYSHADRDWVWNVLSPRLQESGLRLCLDNRDFILGIPKLINIEKAIENSRHTLIIMTPDWLEDEWGEFESLLVGSADPTGHKQKLIPIMLKACTPPKRISVLSYADITDPDDVDGQFDRLLKQLNTVDVQVTRSIELSPFVAGPPIIHPCQFFGRSREVKRIFGLLRQLPLQNAAVLGPRRSGKTSLLLYLRKITVTPKDTLRPGQRYDWLPDPQKYKWVFVDFQDPRLGTRKGLLQYITSAIGFENAKKVYSLEQFFDLMSVSLHNPTIVLLDEIGVALKRHSELDDEFWEGLRSLATNYVNGKLGFILASHDSVNQIAMNNKLSSPFFNIFGYTANLGQLSEQEARELIANSPISFPPEDIDWILSKSEKWPILIQILSQEKLTALEDGDDGIAWRVAGIKQLETFSYLLAKK